MQPNFSPQFFLSKVGPLRRIYVCWDPSLSPLQHLFIYGSIQLVLTILLLVAMHSYLSRPSQLVCSLHDIAQRDSQASNGTAAAAAAAAPSSSSSSSSSFSMNYYGSVTPQTSAWSSRGTFLKERSNERTCNWVHSFFFSFVGLLLLLLLFFFFFSLPLLARNSIKST